MFISYEMSSFLLNSIPHRQIFLSFIYRINPFNSPMVGFVFKFLLLCIQFYLSPSKLHSSQLTSKQSGNSTKLLMQWMGLSELSVNSTWDMLKNTLIFLTWKILPLLFISFHLFYVWIKSSDSVLQSHINQCQLGTEQNVFA